MMIRTVSLAAFILSATLGLSACAGMKVPIAATAPAPAGASLWVEPTDLESRDLFYGPWGSALAPDPKGVYTLVERKHTGVNLGLTVKDARGREWSVKQSYPGGLDPEGPVEITVSRLLSAVGYHQPPIYLLPAFTLKDDFGKKVEVGGRFRLKDASLKDIGSWKWEENPFVGTKPYQGLIVLLMMFNSTDIKNSNNTLYEHKNGDLVEQWYLTRDVGSALGDLNPMAPRKAEFAYTSWYKNLVRDRITPDEVAWACELLGRLSDKQWADAFRAGGFDPDDASRFITKLKEKIDQGRSLGARPADRDQ
jgi:hypothetical protein